MQLTVETSTAFTEANGCLLVEVSPSNMTDFEARFAELPVSRIGKVTARPVFKISNMEVSVNELVRAFNHPNYL